MVGKSINYLCCSPPEPHPQKWERKKKKGKRRSAPGVRQVNATPSSAKPSVIPSPAVFGCPRKQVMTQGSIPVQRGMLYTRQWLCDWVGFWSGGQGVCLLIMVLQNVFWETCVTECVCDENKFQVDQTLLWSLPLGRLIHFPPLTKQKRKKEKVQLGGQGKSIVCKTPIPTFSEKWPWTGVEDSGLEYLQLVWSYTMVVMVLSRQIDQHQRRLTST